MIRLIELKDFDTWIELAKEVEPLFGPMTSSIEFQEGIKTVIRNRNAYGIEIKDGILAGIIAIDPENNEILWLAVGEAYRGKKYGEQLVKKAIEELKPEKDIYVQTFSKQVEEGKGARIIYERNGFTDLKKAGKNPAGIDTVIMVKKAGDYK